MIALGIDLGGTKIAAGMVDEEGLVGEPVEIPTPRDPAALSRAPLELVEGLVDGEVAAVGLGAAGLVRWPEGVLVWGPNVTGKAIPFRTLLEDGLGLPAWVDNDANVAGLAEARLGAGRGCRHMLMVTLGTGIGGALVIDGEIYRGASFAGEIGHMVVKPGGPACSCGGQGCWEAMASGSALDRLAMRVVDEDPDGLVMELAARRPPDGEHVTAAAARGDSFARSLVDELAEWVGLGLANLIAMLDPETIVIGGGVVTAGDLLLDPARQAVSRQLMGAEHRPETPIVPARYGAEAGMIGAGLLALESIG